MSKRKSFTPKDAGMHFDSWCRYLQVNYPEEYEKRKGTAFSAPRVLERLGDPDFMKAKKELMGDAPKPELTDGAPADTTPEYHEAQVRIQFSASELAYLVLLVACADSTYGISTNIEELKDKLVRAAKKL